MRWFISLLLGVALLLPQPATQTFPPEKEPLVDPVRLFEALSGVSWDEPRDESAIIDVVFAFSGSAWYNCGNTEAGCTAIANQVIAQWNTARDNSQSIATLRLCGVMRTSYVEGVGYYANSPLSWMVSSAVPNGGGREELMNVVIGGGCDIVHMVTRNNACGQGYLQASSINPFSQSEWGCTVANFSGIHEIGHNIGLHHEPPSVCGQAVCSGYNYGHAWPTTGVIERDPMTYPGAGGSRVLFWSNPLIVRHGQAIGIPNQRDNARVLRERGAIVAGFRSKVTSPKPIPMNAPTNHPRNVIITR